MVICARPEIHLPDDLDTRLRAALDELTPDQRCCLLLKTILHHDYATIAAILDIPEPTARSHARRARLKLLDLLQYPNESTA
jgi:DNA-directed RNA polymerase specialized sigma24 family protein